MWCGESNQNKMLYSKETLQLLSSLYQRKTGTDTKIFVDVFVNNADVPSSNIVDRQHDCDTGGRLAHSRPAPR